MKGRDVVSQRVRNISGSAIHEMTRLSGQLEDVAFLSWAKPTEDTPEHIKEAAVEAIRAGKVGGYSESSGMLELREEIARKVRSVNGMDASAGQIIVTVGAVEGLSSALMATIDPGDEVILPEPTYSTHIRMVQLASGVPVLVPTMEREGYRLDVDAVREAMTPKTKAILFCSPNNPTGAVYGEKDLRRLANLALENDLVVITDEAYEYFTYGGARHFSIGSIDDMASNAISCFTFTKNYAMTGWRIGYLHAHEELIPQITKAHIPFAICAPMVSQHAALAALKGPQDCIGEFRSKYLSARDLMCRRLDGLDSAFEYQKPDGSYLMFPRILAEGGSDSVGFCRRLLKEAKVSTTPGIAFGPSGEGHLRLSFCVPEEMINRAFDRMEKYFRMPKKKHAGYQVDDTHPRIGAMPGITDGPHSPERQ